MNYIYFPIREQLRKNLSLYQEHISKFSISLNIDGLPIFNRSKITFWPVLCSINLKPLTIFPVVLTCGDKKTDNLDFLEDFLTDLSEIVETGLQMDGRVIDVSLKCVICDAPVIRATLDVIDTQKGKWIKKIIYPRSRNLKMRTDKSFRYKEQQEHHHPGVSPFCKIPVDMVRSFTLDYMHMCCLGVMKRLLLMWLRGSKKRKLSQRQCQLISRRLTGLRRYIPECFARKPRSLDEVDRWKATEFRQFMLYTGRIVLRNILTDDAYKHFLIFNIPMSILVSRHVVQLEEHVKYAEDLLTHFVELGQDL